nr:MAG TPA: hypothetical protein [Caudoviricetes sp.]
MSAVCSHLYLSIHESTLGARQVSNPSNARAHRLSYIVL